MSTDNTAFGREQTMTQEEYRAALTAARQENAELRDKYLRAAAASENARKQAERTAAARATSRLQSLYVGLLEGGRQPRPRAGLRGRG